MGGANIIQQYIKAGLIDELHLHIAPILLKQEQDCLKISALNRWN